MCWHVYLIFLNEIKYKGLTIKNTKNFFKNWKFWTKLKIKNFKKWEGMFLKRGALPSLSFLLRLLNQIWDPKNRKRGGRRRWDRVIFRLFSGKPAEISRFRAPIYASAACLFHFSCAFYLCGLISSRTGLWVTPDYYYRAAIAVPNLGIVGHFLIFCCLMLMLRAEKRIISISRLFLSRRMHFQWCFWALRASE